MFLSGLSAVIFLVSLAFGGAMALSEPSGGFLSGLHIWIGLGIVALGNLLSFLINLCVWWAGTRSRILVFILALQVVPAAAAAFLLLRWGVDDVLDQRAFRQRTEVLLAVAENNVAGFTAAHDACGSRCQARLTRSYELMTAIEAGSPLIARHLVETGALSREADYPESRDVTSCDGVNVFSLGALAMAIAHREADIAALLLPQSSQEELDTALRGAVTLDRLEWIKPLLNAGAQFQTREDKPYLYTLMAVGHGGAIKTARWLFEERPFAITQDEVQGALATLFRFMEITGQPRGVELATLLVQNGADLNGPFRNGTSFLEEAIRTKRGDIVNDLIKAGADISRLSPQDREEIQKLDSTRRSGFYGGPIPGCVS